MGYMTEICILNDQWDKLEKLVRDEPEKLIQELRILMNGRPMYGPRDPDTDRRQYLGSKVADDIHGTQFKVYQSHHADTPVLYLAYQNSFLSIDQFTLDREFGDRLDNPDDHVLDVLERDIKIAERILSNAKGYLKEKREAREKAA